MTDDYLFVSLVIPMLLAYLLFRKQRGLNVYRLIFVISAICYFTMLIIWIHNGVYVLFVLSTLAIVLIAYSKIFKWYNISIPKIHDSYHAWEVLDGIPEQERATIEATNEVFNQEDFLKAKRDNDELENGHKHKLSWYNWVLRPNQALKLTVASRVR